MLNASHQALCYFGYLAGYRLVHEVIADEAFRRFLLAYMEEATPTLRPVPGIDLDVYRRTLIERFGNRAVRDTVARLCAETSARTPKFLLPVVRENLAAGRSVRLSAAIVASWARYAEGVDEAGERIEVVDRLAGQLTAAAARNREDALAFVHDTDVFGDLAESAVFAEAYGAALTSLHTVGAAATVRKAGRRRWCFARACIGTLLRCGGAEESLLGQIRSFPGASDKSIIAKTGAEAPATASPCVREVRSAMSNRKTKVGV